MAIWTAEEVTEWLAARGYEPATDGSWRNADGEELAANELAVDVTARARSAGALASPAP
jgi:hypothetical protein